MKGCTVSVFMDSGVVFEYDVSTPMKGREHAHSIITGGYRANVDGTNDLEWFPPHRILKVRVSGGAVGSKYSDKKRAT